MNRILLCGCIFFALLICGCASTEGKHVKKESVKDTKSIAGNFTVILYGGGHQLETLAVLDSEDDEYAFEPYAPEFNYRIKKHLTGMEALNVASSFLRQKSIRISRITNKQGKIFGYELKRRYWHLKYGTSDILDVTYSLKKDKILVHIMVKPYIEDTLKGN
jgi:uncharacterized SAM-binding protein YcdF (DUF218 family)